MDIAALIISAGLLVVSAAAAVAALVQARLATSARSESEKARDDARTASEEAMKLSAIATAAFVRQAEAQERANEIELAKRPKDEVAWTVAPYRRDIQLVVNTGTRTAYDVRLQGSTGVMTDDDSNADELTPGNGVEFAVFRGAGMGRQTITVHWRNEPGGNVQTRETTVRPV